MQSSKQYFCQGRFIRCLSITTSNNGWLAGETHPQIKPHAPFRERLSASCALCSLSIVARRKLQALGVLLRHCIYSTVQNKDDYKALCRYTACDPDLLAHLIQLANATLVLLAGTTA